MSKNAKGTIFRIILIFLSLIAFWFLILSTSYFLVSILFNLDFNLKICIVLFLCFIIFRMFYPKNVFKLD